MSAIADKLVRKVEVHLGGRDWQLVVTHGVLLDCEALTGKKMLAGGEALKPSAKLVRALLYLMLRRAGADYHIERVGKLITPANAETLKDAVIDAWAASMPDPKPAKGKAAGDDRVLETIEAWAIARHDLWLSDQEWLESTPRQIDELQKRRTLNLQRQEWLTAVLAAAAANAPHWRTPQPRSAREFMTMHPLPDEPIRSRMGHGAVRAAFSRFPKKKAS